MFSIVITTPFLDFPFYLVSILNSPQTQLFHCCVLWDHYPFISSTLMSTHLVLAPIFLHSPPLFAHKALGSRPLLRELSKIICISKKLNSGQTCNLSYHPCISMCTPALVSVSVSLCHAPHPVELISCCLTLCLSSLSIVPSPRVGIFPSLE